MTGWKKRPTSSEPLEFDPAKRDYTGNELEQLADQLLRKNAKEVDPETGKPRGIGGENPILFGEHIYARQRREILNENGVPEPHLVSGIYNRAHPQGRKMNDPEKRKATGAPFFAG